MASRRNNRQRARTAVIVGCLVFAASQAGLVLVFSRVAPTWGDAEFHGRLATFRRRCSAQPDALQVVVVGSSRTCYGLPGADFEANVRQVTGRHVALCNLSRLGAGPVTNLVTTTRMLNAGVRPDLVVVEVLPALLAGQVPLDEIREERLPSRDLKPADLALLSSYQRDEPRDSYLRQRIAQLVPIYSYRLELISRLSPMLLRFDHRRIVNYDPQGGALNPYSEYSEKRGIQQADWFGQFLDDFQLGDRQCRAVRETVATCHAAGVPIALVLTPEGPLFRSRYQPRDWEKISSFLAQLSTQEQVPIIDARHWLDERSFADSQHMLNHGALQFSTLLARQVAAPLEGDYPLVARDPQNAVR
jgi:hypothetical protein